MKTHNLVTGICAGIVFAASNAASAATVWTASWDTYLFSSDLGVGLGTQPYCAPFTNPFGTCPDILLHEKENAADWTLPGNWDIITGSGPTYDTGGNWIAGTGVTITRANNGGLFNIAQEESFEKPQTLSQSPIGTLWAYGSTADLNTDSNPSGTVYLENFNTWADKTFFLGPSAAIGLDMMIYLVAEDIYIDFRLDTWQDGRDVNGNRNPCWPGEVDPVTGEVGTGCGGFRYLRANGTNSTTGVTVNSDPSIIPVPAAVWLFGSGLLGLVGVARRRAA